MRTILFPGRKFLAVVALAIVSLFASPNANGGETTGIQPANHQPVVQSGQLPRTQRYMNAMAKGVHVIDFTATWCAPCVVQAPIVENVANEFMGKVTVWKVDIDKFKDIAEYFQVSMVPSILILKDGAVRHSLGGLQSESDLRRLLDESLR